MKEQTEKTLAKLDQSLKEEGTLTGPEAEVKA
jgi:hypothetical protein